MTATFYATTPGTVVLSVRSGSGAKYEGPAVLFWEARGGATVTWQGVELTCQRR